MLQWTSSCSCYEPYLHCICFYAAHLGQVHQKLVDMSGGDMCIFHSTNNFWKRNIKITGKSVIPVLSEGQSTLSIVTQKCTINAVKMQSSQRRRQTWNNYWGAAILHSSPSSHYIWSVSSTTIYKLWNEFGIEVLDSVTVTLYLPHQIHFPATRVSLNVPLLNH